jgi:hypothetical protein
MPPDAQTAALHPSQNEANMKEKYLPLAKAIVALEDAVATRERKWNHHGDDHLDQTWDQASVEVKEAESALIDAVNAMVVKVATNVAHATKSKNVVTMSLMDLFTTD